MLKAECKDEVKSHRLTERSSATTSALIHRPFTFTFGCLHVLVRQLPGWCLLPRSCVCFSSCRQPMRQSRLPKPDLKTKAASTQNKPRAVRPLPFLSLALPSTHTPSSSNTTTFVFLLGHPIQRQSTPARSRSYSHQQNTSSPNTPKQDASVCRCRRPRGWLGRRLPCSGS
jgi:hypothetical protein